MPETKSVPIPIRFDDPSIRGVITDVENDWPDANHRQAQLPQQQVEREHSADILLDDANQPRLSMSLGTAMRASRLDRHYHHANTALSIAHHRRHPPYYHWNSHHDDYTRSNLQSFGGGAATAAVAGNSMGIGSSNSITGGGDGSNTTTTSSSIPTTMSNRTKRMVESTAAISYQGYLYLRSHRPYPSHAPGEDEGGNDCNDHHHNQSKPPTTENPQHQLHNVSERQHYDPYDDSHSSSSCYGETQSDTELLLLHRLPHPPPYQQHIPLFPMEETTTVNTNTNCPVMPIFPSIVIPTNDAPAEEETRIIPNLTQQPQRHCEEGQEPTTRTILYEQRILKNNHPAEIDNRIGRIDNHNYFGYEITDFMAATTGQHDYIGSSSPHKEKEICRSLPGSKHTSSVEQKKPGNDDFKPHHSNTSSAALEESLQFAARFFGLSLTTKTASTMMTSAADAAAAAAPTSSSCTTLDSSKDGLESISATTLPNDSYQASSTSAPIPRTKHTPTLASTWRRSSPIKVRTASATDSCEVSTNEAVVGPANNRTETTPNYATQHKERSSFPVETHLRLADDSFLDLNDGHIWRQKYCVLQDGILYFYPHKDDAESIEAVGERNQQYEDPAQEQRRATSSMDTHLLLSGSPTSPTTESTVATPRRGVSANQLPLLACSPVPVRRHVDVGREGGEYEWQSDNRVWEKRVPLECVGAVRSAERDYGKHAFELTAVDEESGDKLILRAHDASTMNEWLFQFHLAIATFVRDMMMMHVTPLGGSAARDRSTWGKLAATVSSSSHTRYNVANVLLSPRMHRQQHQLSPSRPTPLSLSHGHGRHAMSRRRRQMTPQHESIDKVAGNPSLSGSRSAYVPDFWPSPQPFERARTSPEYFTQKNTLDAYSLPSIPSFPRTFQQHAVSREPSSMVPAEMTVRAPQRISTASPPTVSSVSVVTPSDDCHYPRQNDFTLDNMLPELSAPVTACPETEHPKPSAKYVPPHLRNRQEGQEIKPSSKAAYVPPHRRSQQSHYNQPNSSLSHLPPLPTTSSPSDKKYIPRYLRKTGCDGVNDHDATTMRLDNTVDITSPDVTCEVSTYRLFSAVPSYPESDQTVSSRIKLGGCADPNLVTGSILDVQYIPRKASLVGKSAAEPFGCISDHKQGISWEIGAISECGVRDSNEDSYLVAKDLDWGEATGLFAIFDGHCGNHAARYAAEKFLDFLQVAASTSSTDTDAVSDVLASAIANLDQEFCTFCVHEGRQWESGSTAVMAVVLKEHLVVANLGDSRAVLCRSVETEYDARIHKASGWNEIPVDEHMGPRRCFWQNVTEAHSPNRSDERDRIVQANGWVTTETEIPIGQLKRMVLCDQDVVDILKRCFADRYQPSPKAAAPQRILQIARVCGELAVSRAIGDRDFKSSYHTSTSECFETNLSKSWSCPLYLPYPANHSGTFVGDLVINKLESRIHHIGQDGVHDEFLLLACDGLWDVIDSDDAIRVTHDLLFEKGWTAKEAAARLAELAIHLGSSDNITVIVVRFFHS